MATCPLPLTVQELPGRVRLCLGDLARRDGPTLQAAADDLAPRLVVYAMAFRSSGFQFSKELGSPDLVTMDFLTNSARSPPLASMSAATLFGVIP